MSQRFDYDEIEREKWLHRWSKSLWVFTISYYISLAALVGFVPEVFFSGFMLVLIEIVTFFIGVILLVLFPRHSNIGMCLSLAWVFLIILNFVPFSIVIVLVIFANCVICMAAAKKAWSQVRRNHVLPSVHINNWIEIQVARIVQIIRSFF